MNVVTPSFGRRSSLPEPMTPVQEPITPDEAPANAAPDHMAPSSQLRVACLAQLDPATLASMTPDRLVLEVERVLSEIATERRFQLNAREQRQLAGELVNDMLGLGPLEPLFEDDSITDIMVNGPNRVFVERHGKVTLSDIKFRDATHVANISQRIASAIGRRIDESSPMVDARLKDGSRVNIVFPPLALDGPYLSIRKFSRQQIDFAKLIGYGSDDRAGRARAGGGGSITAERGHLRRHRLRQDDADERHVADDRRWRTCRHDRGRGRAATAAAARGAHGDAPAQPGGKR
jgi:pilus assembly protein CpaF